MRFLFNFSFLILVIFLTGCVAGTRSIDLVPPKYENTKSASGQIYIAFVEDKRQFEDKPKAPSTPSVNGKLSATSKEKLATLIGRQRNGYGQAMGDVALPAPETVKTEMKALLKEGLESRGYTISSDANAPIKLNVDIEKFWAWFSPGMWAVSFEADVACNMSLSGPNLNKDFNIVGYGINKGQVASDANWALAYQRAFEDFLKNLDKKLDEEGL